MKIIITDSRQSYASKCTDIKSVFQVIKRHFEKGTKNLYMPLDFMTCVYGDLICYIVNNNIEVILDSKRKWFRIRDTNGGYFWTHEIEKCGKDGYCFKPSFVLGPLALSVIYSDKLVFSHPEFKCFISNKSIKRLFSIENVYAFWEYQFALLYNVRDIETLKHHILYNEQAINWLIENKILELVNQKFSNRTISFVKYIGNPIPKELEICLDNAQ